MHRLHASVLALAGVLLLAACGPDETGVRTLEGVSGGAAPEGSTVAARPGAGREPRVTLHGIDLTGIGYTKGRDDAPVVIIEFSDFGCPFCGSHARQTLPALEREFIATGKVLYHYVPFVMGMFPNGDEAARAAECAADQGKFWAMHDTLFAVQQEWKRSRSAAELARGYARGLGIDDARLAACVAGGAPDARIMAANDRAQRLGIRATPTFFVNGRQLEGALPLPQFRELLQELTR